MVCSSLYTYTWINGVCKGLVACKGRDIFRRSHAVPIEKTLVIYEILMTRATIRAQNTPVPGVVWHTSVCLLHCWLLEHTWSFG